MVLATPPRRILVDGTDGDVPIRPPSAETFEDQGVDFLPAEPLTTVVGRLIDAHPHRFGHLVDRPILVLWKAKGGTYHGKPVHAKAVKPSGLAKYYAGPDTLVIWLAADHLRERAVSAWFLEAMLFHELCHFGVNDKGGLELVDHDWQGFGAELAVYGTWQEELLRAKRQFGQLALPEAE